MALGETTKKQLLLFPGLDGTGVSYAPLEALLSSEYSPKRITYPDRPLSFAALLDHAEQQFAGIEEPLVVAESFSGPIVISLTATGRLKPKSIVFAATFASNPRPFLMSMAKWLPLSRIFSITPPNFLLNPLLGGSQTSKALLPMVKFVRDNVSGATLAERILMIANLKSDTFAGGFTMPCCYIMADDDLLVPKTAYEEFRTLFPQIKLFKLKGPHFILQANPQGALDVMEKFWDEQ